MKLLRLRGVSLQRDPRHRPGEFLDVAHGAQGRGFSWPRECRCCGRASRCSQRCWIAGRRSSWRGTWRSLRSASAPAWCARSPCTRMRCRGSGGRRWSMSGSAPAGSRPPAPADYPELRRVGLVHHSDRGVQYTSIRYTKRLEEAGAVRSVGSKGDCPLNGQSPETCRSATRREVLRSLPGGDSGDTSVRHEHGGCLLRLEQRDDGWVLAGPEADRFGLVNEYLSHLADRDYPPRTLRSCGFDLLAFCRWLHGEQIEIGAVTAEVAAA
jgi:hypothetical protein